MDIVGQHNRAGSSFFKDAIANHSGARPLPIQRIDVPENDLVSELIVDPTLLARGERSIRRPHQRWPCPTGGALNGILRSPQFTTHTIIGHLAKIWMRPTVVPNFVTFARRARNDLGVLSDVFADHEESRFNMMGREDIEQFRGERCVWPVVKSHRDVRSIDMNPVERDARLGRRGQLILSRDLRCNRGLRASEVPREESEGTEEEKTRNRHESKRERDASI